MRAVVLSAAGSGLVDPAQVPVPRPGADELLVRVRAIGVGIHDSYFLPAGITAPFPIGIEAAGVVDEVGPELSGRYARGDRIAFVSVNQRKGGTWAEYAVVGADALIVPVPAEMSFERAAAVPVAVNTALRALHALPPILAGGSVFVAGASGAVGTIAVQLARGRGWHVAGSASSRNHEYLICLGATEAVDYSDPGWVQRIRDWRPDGVDAALAVQPNTTAASIEVVKDGGTVVSISGDSVQPPRGVTVTGPSYTVDVRAELLAVLDQIAADEIHLEIEKTYPFDQAPAALAKVQTRHARGKIVLSLD
jgi:NADPH:quinone reductase-like Zn-dependent oxidoreductase